MSSSISLSELEKIVEQVISEQKWGKKQGRDYSKEKKTAGDPKNIARKQARRDAEKKGLVKPGDGKHVHHPNGVDPSAKNGGDYEIVDAADNLGGKESPGDQRARGKPTVKKSVLIKIIEEESEELLTEIAPLLAPIVKLVGKKAAQYLAKKAMGAAVKKAIGSKEEKEEVEKQKMEKDVEKIVKDPEDLENIISATATAAEKAGVDPSKVSDAFNKVSKIVKGL